MGVGRGVYYRGILYYFLPFDCLLRLGPRHLLMLAVLCCNLLVPVTQMLPKIVRTEEK